MANTYQLITKSEPTTNPTFLNLTSIPQTYDDLLILISARNNGAGTGFEVYLNSTSFTTGNTWLEVDTATVGSSRSTNQAYIRGNRFLNTSADTSNTFNNVEIYIPKYTVAASKAMSGFYVRETNSTSSFIQVVASYNTQTTAVTSVGFGCGNGFVTGSTFYLYGIKNS